MPAKRGPYHRKKDYDRKVALSSIAENERVIGEIVEFGCGRYYSVVRIDEREKLAYLRRVGPLE